jgi:hypothetical protein
MSNVIASISTAKNSQEQNQIETSAQSHAHNIASSSSSALRLPRSEKIADHHLQRRAIVYVRQSTQHQVLEHRESTARQYALADRAVLLGWPSAAVEVIDEDQGVSGSSIEGRTGFQRLLAEISADRG